MSGASKRQRRRRITIHLSPASPLFCLKAAEGCSESEFFGRLLEQGYAASRGAPHTERQTHISFRAQPADGATDVTEKRSTPHNLEAHMERFSLG